MLQLCRQRLDAFREQRGEEVGCLFTQKPAASGTGGRHRTPISGSIKVRVLTRAKGRCECYGAGCCSANPASTGHGGGPHRAQEPWRLGRPQQPAGPLLPVQCLQARHGCWPTKPAAPITAVTKKSTANGRMDEFYARWREAEGSCWKKSWRTASHPQDIWL